MTKFKFGATPPPNWEIDMWAKATKDASPDNVHMRKDDNGDDVAIAYRPGSFEMRAKAFVVAFMLSPRCKVGLGAGVHFDGPDGSREPAEAIKDANEIIEAFYLGSDSIEAIKKERGLTPAMVFVLDPPDGASGRCVFGFSFEEMSRLIELAAATSLAYPENDEGARMLHALSSSVTKYCEAVHSRAAEAKSMEAGTVH